MQTNRQNTNIKSTATEAHIIDQGLRSYMLKVYNYMASGVFLTGIVSLVLFRLSGGYDIQVTANGITGLTGIGQALFADVEYEKNGGQLLSASFQDYTMPRADDLPINDITSHPVPTKQNPLGVKGAGETGTVGAPPAVLNAVINSLQSKGVTDIEMPATPEKIWLALRKAA